jgi:adenylosuccinate lyase
MAMSPYDTHTSPLASRNASPEMLRLWSPRHKFNTWRRIWLAVAEAMYELGNEPSVPGPVAHASSPVRQEPGAPRTGEDACATGQSPVRRLVTKEQVEELRAVVERGITDDEIALAEKYERELRHDVMAHVHALGDSCPKAKGIIHLGMTSQDVVCNADIVLLRESLSLISNKLARVGGSLGNVAARTRSIPTLGFTHYQAAQPTTVGRRAAGWAHDLVLCWHRVHHFATHHQVKLRGLRGATGTQAAFLQLLDDDAFEVDLLEALFLCTMGCEDWHDLLSSDRRASRSPQTISRYRAAVERLGAAPQGKLDSPKQHFQERLTQLDAWRSSEQREAGNLIREETYHLTTQTYPRVVDTFILADLASTASVLHKIATDIRLLCNRKELDEPFEDKQIGSSAMPYKRNPMRCERICGLTRFVMNLVGNAYDTAATQWLERTLDDSSNRRLSLPEAFLALDGALDLMHNVASGLVVHEAMVKKNLMAELPLMATENILMECVKLGGDRQHYHELIRVHAQAAGHRVKHDGLDNDLLERLKNDKSFHSTARGGPLREELNWDNLLDPMKYIGRSVEQTERFITDVVEPLRERYAGELAKLGDNAPRV